MERYIVIGSDDHSTFLVGSGNADDLLDGSNYIEVGGMDKEQAIAKRVKMEGLYPDYIYQIVLIGRGGDE